MPVHTFSDVDGNPVRKVYKIGIIKISRDTGHQNVYPSHRQLNKDALFFLIHDKDISSGYRSTLHDGK